MTGDCTAECGGGTRTISRTKIVEELYDGTCEGEAYMPEEACNEQACPGIIQIAIY